MTRLALVHTHVEHDWEPKFLLRVKREVSERGAEFGLQLVESVEQADVVFYVDSSKSTKRLSVHQKILRWAGEQGKFVFSLSIEDRPAGVLPGLYSSLESLNFDSSLHLSWPHLESPNSHVGRITTRPPEHADWLFTFSGSCSHRLRKKLFSMYGSDQQGDWKVNEVDRWYDHTKQEEENYIEDILNSHFVLCPRGIASYSHRIFETMLLERVPVIIADDWVPFSFAQPDYFVKIAEKDIENLTSILEQELERYHFYMSNILKAKSNWLACDTRYCTAIEQFLNFHSQRKDEHDPTVLLDRLKSFEFRKKNGFLSYQRINESAYSLPRRGKKLIKKIGVRCTKMLAGNQGTAPSKPGIGDNAS